MRTSQRTSCPADGRVDEKYYRAARPSSVAERLVIRARDQIYKDFVRICRPSPIDTILDVGVSDVVGDAPNLLERQYPYPGQITAIGLGDADEFQAEFPEVKYRRVGPNLAFPFPDDSFDIVTSNAVLEHVGSVENQRDFIAELMRVARRAFITVPHRFFPVEHHTGIPLLHYHDASFGLACKVCNKGEWAEQSNLILMSRSHFRELWPEDVAVEIGFTGLCMGIFSSNLYAHWLREGG
jgi:hypothetical protein